MKLASIDRARHLSPAAPLEEIAERLEARRCFQDKPVTITLGDTRMETDLWRYDGHKDLLTSHSLRQLCERLSTATGVNVSAGYLARCPDLLAALNLNFWLRRPECKTKRVMVRSGWLPHSTQTAVSAVLSDRYAVVDHLPLMQTLSPLAAERGLEVQSWSLDDEQFTLRLVKPEDHPISLKEPLRVGLHISNSEVGLGCISIAAYLFRLVCTNGLIIKVAMLSGVHRRHIGRAGDSLAQIVHSSMSEVMDQADQAASRFIALKQKEVPKPIEKQVSQISSQLELPMPVNKRVMETLEGETYYDLINAYTRVAQSFPVAIRIRVETGMSRFL